MEFSAVDLLLYTHAGVSSTNVKHAADSSASCRWDEVVDSINPCVSMYVAVSCLGGVRMVFKGWSSHAMLDFVQARGRQHTLLYHGFQLKHAVPRLLSHVCRISRSRRPVSLEW